jgi:hypothetical protein
LLESMDVRSRRACESLPWPASIRSAACGPLSPLL